MATVVLRGDSVDIPDELAERGDLELVYFTATPLGNRQFDMVSDIVHYLSGALGVRGLVWQDDEGVFVFVPKEERAGRGI